MKISSYPLRRVEHFAPGNWQGEIRLEAFGWWLRLFLGITMRLDRPRVRWSRFYGHRLLAVRLRGEQMAGVQWRRSR